MKILQVVHQFLPKYVGGTEVYAADLSRRLRARGHQVALLAGADRAERTSSEGFPLTTVPGGLRGPVGPTGQFLHTFGNQAAEAAFGNLLADFQPDVVHFHHLLGLSGRLPAIASAAGVPTCATLHDYWFLCPKSQLIDHVGGLCAGPKGGVNCALCAAERVNAPALAALSPALAPLFWLRQQRVRRAYAACDVLMAPSDFLLQTAVDAGLPRDRLRRVHFGLDSAAPLPRVPRPPGGPLRVAYLGAIDPSKGVHVLLEACRSLEPERVQVAVYGSFDSAPAGYADRLRALAAASAYGPPVLRGALAHDRVPAMLVATDVLVVPSVWYENAPLVIAEAFAAGVPVVASNQGALAEQVRDGVDGLLFARDDAGALAATLQGLADDDGLLERLRAGIQAGRSRDEHVNEVEAVYRELVEMTAPRIC